MGPCNGVLVVDITTDNYGSETQWTVKGSDGNLIAQNSGSLSSFTTYTTDVCIMDYECHTFETTDFCLVSNCLDDPDFVKTRGNKNQNIDRTCAYIGAGDRPWRLNKWCNKRHRGELIKDICCNTCDDVAIA